ncbi:hypothetical protein M409DRAFT_29271 [Zasmidium cellare ATCC 36951]|uniref:BTB domain-containing protein n=1 Tax=Zasmidium cellare ATCC 36951 TaxID=1080233 RepID=A0A6A6C377_ZASCE|nr:uncharacterized protein M409DRAFT_29271 [Zasmidium cellare ATCC 36951]KAF2160189.1 hypothetical protein M409DRAFT_29271 [Zasmidium cellare ATCC 36951]
MSLQINNASKIREDTIITVATKCAVSSGLYRWLVDILVCTHTTPSFKEQRMGWPKQLRCDISESVIELADKSIFKKKLSLIADLPKTTAPSTPHPLIIIADQPPYERTFSVNRTLYTTHSKLLRRATSEAPSPDLAIALPGIRALDFEAYATHHSHFRQDLAILADMQWEAIKPKNCILTPAQKTHVRVATLLGYWIMGNGLQDTEFKNVVMDALLREDLAGDGGAAIVQSAGCILSYGQTGAESGLYRLLLDVMAPMVTEEFVDEFAKTWSRDFVVDLLKRVVVRRGGQDVEVLPTLADRQRYYEVEAKVAERLVGATE